MQTEHCSLILPPFSLFWIDNRVRCTESPPKYESLPLGLGLKFDSGKIATNLPIRNSESSVLLGTVGRRKLSMAAMAPSDADDAILASKVCRSHATRGSINLMLVAFAAGRSCAVCDFILASTEFLSGWFRITRLTLTTIKPRNGCRCECPQFRSQGIQMDTIDKLNDGVAAWLGGWTKCRSGLEKLLAVRASKH